MLYDLKSIINAIYELNELMIKMIKMIKSNKKTVTECKDNYPLWNECGVCTNF